jgi:lipopolysaccharide transport system ATP-binding protein
VERFLDVPVKRYSSGMYVRLAFAVAAHLDPEILVVDEVLAVGDAQFQQKCLGKMKEVSRSGRTILFVSHNMNAVRSLCDRAVLLAGGRVVEDGPVAAVAARYAATSHEPRLERVWPDPERAPRNATTILERVSIRKLDGQADDALTIADAFRIDVHYRVAVAGAKVGVTAMLHDAEGQCIFSSIGNREPAWYGKPMPAGRYRSSCTVPGNLLNSGTFSLSLLLFGSRFMDEFHAPEALVFDLGDSPALRSDFHGDWKGAIRPDLGWTTTPVGEDGA